MQNNVNGHNKLLTIGQASEYLGVSVDTLRRWEKKGRIEPYRSPGGHRHYDRVDLDKLFDKRYTRDEPTIRSSKTTKEEESKNIPVDVQGIKVKDPEETTTYPKITLPAWRAIKDEVKDIETEVEESLELIEERLLERPVREVKIPNSLKIQVTQQEAAVSPNEAYFKQQTVSVLNPPSQFNERKGVLNSNPSETKHPTKKNLPSANFSIQDNKALLIYISVMASIVLFGIAWYFLWKNSQTVLSPIP